jgi:hypothetical protein
MAAFFSKKKETNDSSGITDADNILGHIDELISQRIVLTLSHGKNQIRVNAVSIEEKDNLIKISCPEELGLSAGNRVRVGFPLDGTWLQFDAAFTPKNGGLYLGYPSAIEPNERRGETRTIFSPREEASAALLESFGKGLGIQGILDNISSKAFTVKVLRAIDLVSEKEVRFHENTVKPGQEFMLCRLKGIPGVPMIETAAEVIRIGRKGNWQMVMAFKNLSSELANALSAFAQSRNRPYEPTNRSYQRKKLLREEMTKRDANADKTPAPAVVSPETRPPDHPKPPSAPAAPATEVRSEADKTPQRIELPIKLIRRLQEGPYILTLGEALNTELSFLYDLGNHWRPCSSIKEMIRTLQNMKSAILIVPKTLNDQPVLEYMDKLAATGAMEHITLLLFADSGLSSEEVVMCKKARVKRVFPQPLSELEPFLAALLSAQAPT